MLVISQQTADIQIRITPVMRPRFYEAPAPASDLFQTRLTDKIHNFAALNKLSKSGGVGKCQAVTATIGPGRSFRATLKTMRRSYRGA